MASRRTVAWLAASLLANAAIAGMEWQLIDQGVPLGGSATHLVRTGASGTTYLRIEDQYMVAQFWKLQGNAWDRVLEATYPEAFYEANLAYDPVRNVIVRFGGADKDLVIRDETWEFDGTTWIQRTDVGAPPGRIRAAMAYDTGRNVMVLFGGYDNNDQVRNDTWEYDGVSWQERTFSEYPQARYDATMSYDEGRRRMVLAFGRSNTFPAMNDTWEYDGRKWTKPVVPSLPTHRAGPASAYDPIRGAVYAFGGEPTGETVRWNGSSWGVVNTPVHPAPRYRPNMVFDGARGTIVLYGGAAGIEDFGDSWDWDGSTWTQFADGRHDAARHAAAAALDPVTSHGILFGGVTCCSGVEPDRTAEWDGATWSDVPTPTNPGRLSSPSMEGTSSDRVLLFGGFDVDLNQVTDRMWRFDPSLGVWTEIAPGGPEARADSGMVSSPAHDGIVLFGGALAGGYLTNDTWLFRLGRWEEIQSPVRPNIREGFGLAADTTRGTVVLYGGRYGSGLSDTWILSGGTWEQSPASGPGIRRDPTMTFDGARGRTVLATGADYLNNVERTWEFDGVSWLPVTTRYSPDHRRSGATMFWDPVRHVAVLSGGRPVVLWPSYSDTWAYGPDDDGDLRVGGHDNCPQIPNADQANSDLDARGDLCDCAPGDSGSWSSPVTVQSLVASGTASTTLSWADQGAVVGPGVMYDVVTGGLVELQASGSFAAATCHASYLGMPSASDSRIPETADGFYYLVRGRNTCGLGTFERAELDASSLCP